MNQQIEMRGKAMPARPGLWLQLQRRYAARRGRHRPLPWLGYTLSAANVVALAFFVFDAPLGAAAKDLSVRLVWIAGTVTDVGRLISVLVIAGVVLVIGLMLARRLSAIRRRFRIAYFVRLTVYVAISVLSASIVVHLLKYAIGRARPPLFDLVGTFHFEPFQGDFLHQSFPSAHSTHIGAFFAALALLFPRFRLVLFGMALWLGATRIIVGVHYPSDVAAGLAMGAWFAFATAFMFSRFGLLFSLTPSAFPVPRKTLSIPPD